MKKYIKTSASWFTAILFIVFGLNKFLGFVNPPPPTDPTALNFLGAMFGSYLATFVGIIEIVGALLLILPRTRFIGLLFLFPVVANIVAFHLVHDNPGNAIWIAVTAIFLAVCYSEKNSFQKLLTIGQP